MDKHTKEQRSYNMSRIRSSNTSLELKFFKLLKENRIKYIKHPPKIYGKPDCLVGKITLVFIDSDFWHGWHFSKWKERLPKMYWQEKISRNIKRDKDKFRLLKNQGYEVLRIWEHSLQNPDKVLAKLKKYI